MTNTTDQLATMDAEEDLIKVRDELFRKVGRNLINFQNIEQLLKQLILNTRISGPASQLEEIRRRKSEEINVQTMGTLVGQFFDNAYQAPKDSIGAEAELKEINFSTSIHFNVDADFLESRKAELKMLTDARNNLVHHLMPTLNLKSIDSCLAIGLELDAQREMQIKEHTNLILLSKHIIDLFKTHAAFMASDEGMKLLELQFLQQSRLMTMLLELSATQSRPDGWAVLDRAVRHLPADLADDINRIKKDRGCKTMKALIIACELFDVVDEPTRNGGTRVLYRVKSDLADVYH